MRRFAVIAVLAVCLVLSVVVFAADQKPAAKVPQYRVVTLYNWDRAMLIKASRPATTRS